MHGFVQEDGGGSLSVAARYTADALLPVEPANVVSWEWKVEAYDLGFGVQVLYDDGQLCAARVMWPVYLGWFDNARHEAGQADGQLVKQTSS